MRKLKCLLPLLICFPVMPDLSCAPVFASDATPAEAMDSYLAAILFFICVLFGNRLWKVFINSFERGSV